MTVTSCGNQSSVIFALSPFTQRANLRSINNPLVILFEDKKRDGMERGELGGGESCRGEMVVLYSVLLLFGQG